jgi:hypothetical protein
MNDEKGKIKDWLSDQPVGDPSVSVNNACRVRKAFYAAVPRSDLGLNALERRFRLLPLVEFGHPILEGGGWLIIEPRKTRCARGVLEGQFRLLPLIELFDSLLESSRRLIVDELVGLGNIRPGLRHVAGLLW